jgi:hypothetical protein
MTILCKHFEAKIDTESVLNICFTTAETNAAMCENNSKKDLIEYFDSSEN